jgi:MscS family membrane protein
MFFFREIWAFKILSAFLIAIFLNYFFYIFYKKIKKTLFKNNFFFLQFVLSSIYQPLFVYIWLTFFIFVLKQLPLKGNEIYDGINFYIKKINVAKNIIIFWWSWFKISQSIEKVLLKSKDSDLFDKTKVQIISKIVRIFSVTLLLISLFPIFSIPLSGILTFIGSSAFVVGFANKDLFANYFAGLMIHFDKHFKVGDWIVTYCSGKEVEGFVEFIGWRSTLIRTKDKRALFIPNYTFLSSTLENISRSTHLRIYEEINIFCDNLDKVPFITEQINRFLSNHVEIDSFQNNYCVLEKILNNSLSLRISAYTKSIDRMKYKLTLQNILQGSCQIIINSGAKLIVPINLSYIEK